MSFYRLFNMFLLKIFIIKIINSFYYKITVNFCIKMIKIGVFLSKNNVILRLSGQQISSKNGQKPPFFSEKSMSICTYL